MAITKGFNALTALKKAASWHIPVVCGAGDGFEITDESVVPERELAESRGLTGSGTQFSGDAAKLNAGGDISAEAKYEGLDLALALAMGTAGVPAQQGGEDCYLHTLALNDDLEGLFATWCVDYGFEIWEFANLKIGGLGFDISESDFIGKFTFPSIAHNMNQNVGSGTNTNATFASVTLPTNRDLALFSQVQVLINDASAGALASGTDDVYTTGLNVTLDNMLEGDFTTKWGYLTEEPIPTDFKMVTGEIQLPHFDNVTGNALLADQLAKTKKKMEIILTGPVCDTSYFFSLKFIFPEVQFATGAPPVDGPGKTPWTIAFKGSKALAAPTGMTVTEALTIEMQNQNGADPLA